ncbi:MAG: hypothetical protein CSA53_01985 [Gammaproteobacteria bacterium]|nr:MAG: hypothetical protein CSA53_01985 [Gammaproteobacteria bacterium]
MALTALQSLDMLERLYAFDANEAPVIANDEMRWVGTAVAIAGVPLLLGEGQIKEIIETPAYTRIPGAGPWVLGIAAHKGGLLPVFDGDRLFRKRGFTGAVRNYCIVIDKPGAFFAITLSEVIGNRKFPLQTLEQHHPLDPAFADYCLGGFKRHGTFYAILDVDQLVKHHPLLNTAASESGDSEETQHD